MELDLITEFLGWCLVINFVILFSSLFVLILLKEFVAKIHSKLFTLPNAELNKYYFQYLGNYKIGILLFNFAPYLALKLMAS